MRPAPKLIATLAALLCFAAAAGASLSSEQQRQQQITREKSALQSKIRDAEARAKKISSQIAESDARRATLERQIAAFTQQISQAEAELVVAEAELGAARTDLYALEGSLAQALGRLDEMRDSVSARARASYKLGTGVYLEFLLGSDSYTDLVNRMQFVRKVFAEDRSRVAAVERLTKQLEGARDQAALKRDDLTAKKLAIEERKAQIATLKAQMQGARREVIAEISNRQQLLSKVNQEKAAYLDAMRRLEAESRSIAALLKSRQRGQVYRIGTGTRLAWPATGPVTSGFGWRTHPVFGDRRFHAGIDIGAPYGAAVIASEAGTVVYAANRSGYGLLVIIDHGNALATLYAHLSATSVSSGSRVTRGQRIASVGCSGYCTGPHLHFETRINGDPVDPMQFF